MISKQRYTKRSTELKTSPVGYVRQRTEIQVFEWLVHRVVYVIYVFIIVGLYRNMRRQKDWSVSGNASAAHRQTYVNVLSLVSQAR